MRVEYAQLALTSSVLRRQSDDHVSAMVAYVKRYSVLTPADTGVIMLPFCGISLAVSVVGVRVLEGVGALFTFAADAVDSAADAYAVEERRLHEAAVELIQQLGGHPAALH